MSLFYSFAYRLGFRPWEQAASHPAAADHIERLFDRVEGGRARPYGGALDIGCGTGHWTVVLARRGWDVTGVELVPRAARMARERVRTSGTSAEIIEGDVSNLSSIIERRDFRFVWDFGTMHGLPLSQQTQTAEGITAVSAVGASLLMLAWAPARRGPLPRGMNREEIAATFSGWRIIDDEPFDVTGLPPPLRRVAPRVYHLQRAA